MEFDCLVAGGAVVFPDRGVRPADIAIAGGRIAAIVDPGCDGITARERIDAAGRHVFPGLIDAHMHFGFAEKLNEYTTETRYAAQGGFATVIGHFMSSNPYSEVFPAERAAALERSYIDFGFHFGMATEAHLAELATYIGEFGVSSFKYFTNFKGDEGLYMGLTGTDDGFLWQLVQEVARFPQALLAIHPENIEIVRRYRVAFQGEGRGTLRDWSLSKPPVTEAADALRAMFFAEQAGCPLYFVHTSSRLALDEIARYRGRYPRLHIETCPQYLTHTMESDLGSIAKANPPLRAQEDVDALWQGLADGTIEVVGADHVARKRATKEKNIWQASQGFPGTAMILPVLLGEGYHKGRLGLQRIAQLLCRNPARLFGLDCRKGDIFVGADADLTLVDLDRTREVRAAEFDSYSDYSLYDGWNFKGWPVLTMVRGTVVMRDGRIVGPPGHGRFLKRPLERIMSMPPIARRVAEFAASLRAGDIPPPVIAAAKRNILDTLGVGLAAAATRTRPRIEDAVAALGQGEDSSALGLARRLPAASAALFNGTLMHALEFDATHMASVVHGSAVVLPAALAMAERQAATGADLLRAFVLAWEFFIRLGLAAPNAVSAFGFQTTAVGGPFAAALAAAALMRLDPARTTAALGIAGSQGGGVFEFLADGSMAKHIHGGWPAHAGIVAAELARAGLTGPATIFEGCRGFYRAYARSEDAGDRLAALVATLGDDWHLPETALKIYPCCHYVQPFVECLDAVLARGIDPAAVADIHCRVPAEPARLVCEPWDDKLRPATPYAAKWSLPYCLAARLVDGRLDIATFDRARPDERLFAAARKVRYTAAYDTAFPLRYPGHIEIVTADGAHHSAEVADPLGSPARPLDEAALYAKFRAAAGMLLGPAAVETALTEIMALDAAASLAPLTAVLRA